MKQIYYVFLTEGRDDQFTFDLGHDFTSVVAEIVEIYGRKNVLGIDPIDADGERINIGYRIGDPIS